MIWQVQRDGQTRNMKPPEVPSAGCLLARAPKGRRNRRLAPLLCVLLLTSLPLGGIGSCKKKGDQPPPQPVATNTPPPSKILVAEPSPPPTPPPPAPTIVEAPPPDPVPSLGDRNFQNGRYREAAAAYEADLEKGGDESPEALIRLALAYQLGPDAEAKRERVVGLLKQALEAKPDILLASVAQSLLALLDRNQSLAQDSAQKDRRIRQLSEELERLKQIDLRRRPPGS